MSGPAALLFLLLLASCDTEPRTNLLLITLDTTRADHLRCYNADSPLPTPALDRLAARGTLFLDTITPAPLTLPAHASLLTGLLPARHGVRDNSPDALPPQARTLAELLGERGYVTAAFVAGEPLAKGCGLEQGFQLFDDGLAARASPLLLRERDASDVTGSALDWLSSLVGMGARPPFFVWVHYFDPHVPHRLHPGSPAPSPYASEIAHVDAHVDRLLRFLEDSGLDAETLVAVVADHGEGLGEHEELTHGYFLYQSTLRVPLILAGPGVPRGRRAPVRSSLVDVVPTVLALVGIPALPGVATDGVDLLGAPPKSRSLIAETHYGARHFGWAPLNALLLRDHKWIEGTDLGELYDLREDPEEGRDLARGGQAALAVELSARLREGIASIERMARHDAAVFPRGLPGYLSSPAPAPAPAVPGPSLSVRKRVVRSFDGALLDLQKGLPHAAVARLEEALEADPENPGLHFWLGQAHHEGAKAEASLEAEARALASYRRTLALRPDHIQALNMQIWVLARLGEFGEAARLGLRAVEREVADGQTFEVLGRVYGMERSPLSGRVNLLHDLGQARRFLEEALSRRPHDERIREVWEQMGFRQPRD